MNTKLQTMLLSSIFFVAMLLVPDFVFAQGFVPCDGTDCTFCHFIALGNNILNWLFGVVFVIFGVITFVAGFGLVTSGGNQSKLDDAKKKLSNAIIGIIIIFAAWLLVDTLMKAVIEGGDIGAAFSSNDLGPWNEVSCIGTQSVPTEAVGTDSVRNNIGEDCTDLGNGTQECDVQTVSASSPLDPPYKCVPTQGSMNSDRLRCSIIEPISGSGSGGGQVDSPDELAHATAASQLGGNFTLSSTGGCNNSSIKTCTSLEGIKKTTIDRITELQENVGVPLVITGGTETGHSTVGPYTHSSGHKLDLRTTPQLNDYIYNNFTLVSGTTYSDSNGNTYYRHEPDHWDVTIKN